MRNIARSLNVKLDMRFRVEPTQEEGTEVSPAGYRFKFINVGLPSWVSSNEKRVYTVEEVLTNYCDLTSQPSRTLLLTLAQYAADPKEKYVIGFPSPPKIPSLTKP